jgi:predicted transcriptional regulator of viral defense system
MKKKPIHLATAVVHATGKKSLTREEIGQFITPQNKLAWQLPDDIKPLKLANAFAKEKIVSAYTLKFPSRNVVRYVWGDPSPYEVAQSIDQHGYFSHFSAMRFNGLTDQIPKIVYFNIEQQMRAGGGELEQTAINRIFKGKCRVTNNIADYEGTKITVLNGSNTGCLGVVETEFEKTTLRVTDIERTLIDAVVRPIYSGGIFEVLNAYRAAREKASIPRLAEMLVRLNYTYPYHQVIGVYLEKAGYKEEDLDLMQKPPIEFDFYLDYAMRQTEYNSRWKLYVPKGF